MKKYLLGLFTIALAISASAFTKTTHTNKLTGFYWFQTDALGNITSYPATAPNQLDEPPFGCENQTEEICSKGYLNIKTVGSHVEPDPAPSEVPQVRERSEQ